MRTRRVGRLPSLEAPGGPLPPYRIREISHAQARRLNHSDQLRSTGLGPTFTDERTAMTTTIVGLFDEEESAHYLHQEIKKRGIKERDVELLNWKRLDERSDPWNLNMGEREDKDLSKSLASHLRNWGVSDDDSRDFARAVRKGGNIVLARCDDDHKIDEITKLMEEKEAVDLDERREMWRNGAVHDEEMHDSVHLE